MSITRSFLLALSLARLLEKERGGRHVLEGYFPDRHARSLHVRVEEATGSLILVTAGPGESVEAAAALPLAQAEALLDLAAGGLAYQRIDLDLGTGTAAVRRIMAPGVLDLITVSFDFEEEARAFEPPAWFGPEGTADPSYRGRSLAIAGLPRVPEVELTDAALHSLLEALEDGSTSSQVPVEPSVAMAPPPARDPEKAAEDLDIEDSIIRELAHSLRPKHR
jgi:CYTH domain-containing protein